MEGDKLFYSVKKPDELKTFVRIELQNEYGIKVPKEKKKKLNQSRNVSTAGIFGSCLSLVPSTHVPGCGPVPSILVDAVAVIEPHINMEGIFRKNGSTVRISELKFRIEKGERLDMTKDFQYFLDITSIFKQFLKDLPDCLLTRFYHDSFIQCCDSIPLKKVEAILLLCLLLPPENLSTLRFIMQFLSRVAHQSMQNQMDEGNLAVVLAPNLMYLDNSPIMTEEEKSVLHIQRDVVQVLIHNADRIGVVPPSLCARLNYLSDDGLDVSDDNLLEGDMAKKKRRKRSGSLQGLLNGISKKLRHSFDGKRNSTVSGSSSSLDSQDQRRHLVDSNNWMMSQSQSQSLSVSHVMEGVSTPIAIRTRKMEDTPASFSAKKKKALKDHLPQSSLLPPTAFTPVSSKKHAQDKRSRTLSTPKRNNADESQNMALATPKQNADKSLCRMKIPFSPASGHKTKRSKSTMEETASCSSAIRKSRRPKNFLKRLSGGVSKTDKIDRDEDMKLTPQALGYTRVVHSRSMDTLEKNPADMARTVSSPSLLNTSTPSSPTNDGNALNQAFIDPDSLDISRSVSQPDLQQKDRGQTQKCDISSMKGMVHSNQSNMVCDGLQDSQREDEKKVQHRFDKSEASELVPVSVPTVPEKPQYGIQSSRSVSATHSEGMTQHPQTGEMEFRSDNCSERAGNIDRQGHEWENSLLDMVLPPPSDFTDTFMQEKCSEVGNGAGSDNESEAGFSTISGGTVIHNPAPKASLSGSESGSLCKNAHYGSSVSVALPDSPVTLQPSASCDSLMSIGSESSAVSLGQNRNLDRSASVDSGKGSLGEDVSERAESRENLINKTYLLSSENNHTEGSAAGIEENDSPLHSVVQSAKTASAEDLQVRKVYKKTANHSNSIYKRGPNHPQNTIPNLQISEDTLRMLLRAGKLKKEEGPSEEDCTLPTKGSQGREAGSQGFSRNHDHTCSFRQKRSTALKELEHHKHTPVKEQKEGDSTETPLSSDMERKQAHDDEGISKKREHVKDGTESEKRKDKEDWMLKKPTAVVPRSKAEDPSSSRPTSRVTLKHAEVRIKRHDSVVHMMESNAGRVAQSVNQFNSSLDNSLDNSGPRIAPWKRGNSPIRIPHIFVKKTNNHPASYYQDLARKAMKDDHVVPNIKERSFHESHRHRNKQNTKTEEMERDCTQNLPDRSIPEDGLTHTKRESMQASVETTGTNIDLSSSAQDTIETTFTPQCHWASSQSVDSCRSPLRESTNLKSSPSLQPEATKRLRTSKGLTPHQVSRYGPKAATSERSPGKPVKRLHSPRSPHSKRSSHSPNKSRDSQRLESCHFDEHY